MRELILYFSRADENYFGGSLKYIDEGSGMGRSETDLKKCCPGAVIKKVLQFREAV